MSKEKTIIKRCIELPLFTGFYAGVLNYDNENLVNLIITPDIYEKCLQYVSGRFESELSDILDELVFDMLDYTSINKALAKQANEAVRDILISENLATDLKYEKLYQPYAYNFDNDRIDAVIRLSSDNINTIKKFISKTFKDFEQDVKDTSTSRDGFISFHENKADKDVWKIDNIIKNHDNAKLKFVLSFILNRLNYSSISILYSDYYCLHTVILENLLPEYNTNKKIEKYLVSELKKEGYNDPLADTGYYNVNQTKIFK
ncbi:MAG: hypothetical protein K9K32_00020 [Halanaerobiales bacterium]|nr:hypothetical protein [Halanaerobiales bacterium]